MASDRPMSEHEGALFDAVQVLAKTLLDLGADRQILRSRLNAVRDSADALGNRHGAATLDFLISAVFPGPETPNPRPTFRVV
jgi:hypothetical protein